MKDIIKFISGFISKKKHKINVIFLMRESSLFYKTLYEAFKKDPKFNVIVVALK